MLEDDDEYKIANNKAKETLDIANNTLKSAKEANNYDEIEKEYNSANDSVEQVKTKYKQAEKILKKQVIL